MAENKKFDSVPVTVQTNPTDKFFRRKMPSQAVEPKSSWSWREKFLRGIGVAFLYGNVIKQIPVEDLKLMVGACAEGERGAFMMMLALLQLIRELTVVPRLQRPRRSLRDRVRRMRTYCLLARVLYNMAREDDLVQRVISILHPQDTEEPKAADVDQKVDNQQKTDGKLSDLEKKVEELEKMLVEQANVQRNLMEMLGEANVQVGKAEEAAKKLDAKLQELQGETKADADDDQKVDKQSRRGIIATKQSADRRAACIAVKMPDTTDNQDTVLKNGDWSWLEESGEDSQPDGKESEELPPTVLVDNAALQRLCDEHYEGEIVVPISVARGKVGKSKSLAEAWVQQVAEKYGLSVRLGFLPAKELPNLSKSQKESGLSANDCLTVRYGLGVAKQDCPEIARVEFDDPAIKSFYMQELDKLLGKRAKRA